MSPVAELDLKQQVASLASQLQEALDTPRARFLTIAGASSYSGLSTLTIRRLIAAGRLKSFRPVPRRIVIDRLELDRYIESTSGR